MKRISYLLLFLCVFFPSLVFAGLLDQLRHVTLPAVVFKDTPVPEAVKALDKEMGRASVGTPIKVSLSRIDFDPALLGTVTMSLHNASGERVVDSFAKAARLDYVFNGNVVVFKPKPENIPAKEPTKHVLPPGTSSAFNMGTNTFVLRDGRKYEDCKVSQIRPDGIVILCADGVITINVLDLSDDDAKRFGFDVADYTAKAKKAAERRRAFSNMKVTRDEMQKVTWLASRFSSDYIRSDSFFLTKFYLGKHDSGRLVIRLAISYYGSDWIFYKKVIFLINGSRVVSFDLSDIDRKVEENGVLEWSDILIKDTDDFLAFAGAKTVQVCFDGQTSVRFMMTSDQLNSIGAVVRTYRYLIAHPDEALPAPTDWD